MYSFVIHKDTYQPSHLVEWICCWV